MNVGHPSNLARLFSLYGGQLDETGIVNLLPDIETMKKELFAVSISDEETMRTIKEAYTRYNILLEPHGAVGYAGLLRYLEEIEDWSPCVSLETADPAKFPEEIVRLTGVNPQLPKSMATLDQLDENFDKIDVNYSSLKDFLVRFAK
jgi:threonine synthase